MTVWCFVFWGNHWAEMEPPTTSTQHAGYAQSSAYKDSQRLDSISLTAVFITSAVIRHSSTYCIWAFMMNGLTHVWRWCHQYQFWRFNKNSLVFMQRTERRPCLSEKLISQEAQHEKRNVMQLLHTADNKDIREINVFPLDMSNMCLVWPSRGDECWSC